MAAEMLTSGASGRVSALLSVRAWRTLVRLVAAILFMFVGPFTTTRNNNINNNNNSNNNNKRASAKVVRRVTVEREAAVRRALAVKAVEDDKDDHRDGGASPETTTVREYALFGAPSGVTLFTQSWSPLNVPLRGLVLLLHGLNEHSGRYSEFAKQLNGIGFKVYGMDWIGHGGSDGLHAYVPSLDSVVTDMKAFLDNIVSKNPGLPCFCIAHSTGAAIALKAALDPKVQDKIRGFVLSSPAVSVKPSHPILTVIAPIVSLLLPRYQCQTANKPGTVVSRDPEALLAKYSDPLVYTGAIRVRTGYEILRICAYLQENLSRIRSPFIVLHGSADAVTDPEGSKKLHDEASSKDKMIKLYDGLLHDILFEPERKAVVRDIMEWLEKRVQD